MRPAESQEAGAISVYAVIAMTALVMIALLMTEAGALIAMRHRSAAAADLAALAASRASTAGGDGCAAADGVARRNNAEVVACAMDADVATVTARATSKRWWGMRWKAEVKARAAPNFYFNDSNE